MKFETFRVTIKMHDTLVGGLPIVPEGAERADAYEKWARGQGVEQDPSFAKPLHEALAEDPDMPVAVAVEEVEGLETGFRRDEQGIYIEARQVKAMIRESSQRLGLINSKRGFRQVLQHDLHVRALDGTQKLRMYDEEGNAKVHPDGKDSRPISVVTRQGPRTSIKRFEYVEGATIVFDVLVLRDGIAGNLADEDDIEAVIEFGGWIGLGADRSQGMGTFEVVMIESI